MSLPEHRVLLRDGGQAPQQRPQYPCRRNPRSIISSVLVSDVFAYHLEASTPHTPGRDLPRSEHSPRAQPYDAGPVIVMVFVGASHWTSAPSCSATNRTGSMVRPPTISGTTLGFVASIET